MYTKTYGTIESITYHCYRNSYNYQENKVFTKKEYQEYRTRQYWQHRWEKRYLCKVVILSVKIDDTGEIRELDAAAYQGHRSHLIDVGKRIKIYQRPQDRRGYCYSLTGD